MSSTSFYADNYAPAQIIFYIFDYSNLCMHASGFLFIRSVSEAFSTFCYTTSQTANSAILVMSFLLIDCHL